MITEVFEDSDEMDINIDKMTEIFNFLIINGDKQVIFNYLNKHINDIRPWNLDPHRIFNLTVKMCSGKYEN